MKIRNPWVVVTISSSAFFMSYFGRMVWSVTNAYSTLNPTVDQTGLVFSLFFVGYIVVQVPAGLASDKFKPNIVTGSALVGLAGALVLGGIAPSMEVEYVSSLALGLCAGWIYPGTLKIMTVLFPRREERTVAIGYYSLAWPLSIILLGIVLPPIVLSFGWAWGYYIVAIVALIIGVLAYLSKIEAFVPQKPSLSFLVGKNAIILALAGFLFYFAYWPITFFAYDYFLNIGLSDYAAGIALSALAIAGIPSTFVSGFVMNKIGIKKIAIISLVAYGVIAIALPEVRAFVVIIPIALAMGFFRFFITPTNSAIVSVIGEDRAGSLSGFVTIFWQGSGIIGPVVAAYMIDVLGYSSFWYAMGLIVLSSCIFYAVLHIPSRKTTEKT